MINTSTKHLKDNFLFFFYAVNTSLVFSIAKTHSILQQVNYNLILPVSCDRSQQKPPKTYLLSLLYIHYCVTDVGTAKGHSQQWNSFWRASYLLEPIACYCEASNKLQRDTGKPEQTAPSCSRNMKKFPQASTYL